MRTATKMGIGASVITAASAVAASAWQDYENRSITLAIVPESQLVVQRLYDISGEREYMELIQRELYKQWGSFGPADMDEMDIMTEKAGKMFTVIRNYDGNSFGPPRAILQKGRANIHGDPARLKKKYPSYADMASNGSWEEAKRMWGDTEILMQITAFETGSGIGGVLRDIALYTLPPKVSSADTMTPRDIEEGKPEVDLSNPDTYTQAMRFHYRRGTGATPVAVLEGYKAPYRDGQNYHSEDIVVMRYSRKPNGQWNDIPEPNMIVTKEPFGTRLSSNLHLFESLLQETARIPTYLFSRAQ